MKGKIQSTPIINAATATGYGERINPWSENLTFQAIGATTAGAGAATVEVYVSNVTTPGDNDWILLDTLTLVLSTTPSSDSGTFNQAWRWYRGRVQAISGTGASVSLYMGGKAP